MKLRARIPLLILSLASVAALQNADAQRSGVNSPFPGGENPDGSLRPSARLSRLFTQDAYTEYTLLEPGSGKFRIRYFVENSRAGSTELVNATRAGSEGTDVEVYDPRTGKPMQFEYVVEANGDHAIHAKFSAPVPEGGIGRVLIYKTYHDERTYQVYNEANSRFNIQPGDISWVRSLSGYRLGVILPKGYSVLSMNVAAQLSISEDGRAGVHFANPSGQGNSFTLHARRTSAAYKPSTYTDMFFDDVKTLYDLDEPETHRIRVNQIYSDFRRGSEQPVDLLTYAPLTECTVTDLDTAKPLATSKSGGRTIVKLDVPITSDRQSSHLEVGGVLTDQGYKLANGVLVFDRPMKGLRNTVLLPTGYEVTSVSQSATIGTYQGRVFVALINLNAENSYRVAITAQKAGS
jgi:hypothetical protein